MMRAKILCLSFIFSCFTTLAISQSSPLLIQNSDLYWISYIYNGDVFLMQIDSAGTVTKTPNQILLPKSLDSKVATTISKNGTEKINVWILAKDGTIYRAPINKQTLSMTKVVRTALRTTNSWIFDVTQKSSNNFLVVEGVSKTPKRWDFLALGVSPIGVAKGEKWQLLPIGYSHLRCCIGGSVSGDGKAAAWFEPEFIIDPIFSEESELHLQLLDDSGRTVVNPQIVAKNIAPFFGQVSVSNIIGGVVRFVIFETIQPGQPNRLFLQSVNAQSGSNIGDRVLLKKGTASGLAIDPLGGFFIYTFSNPNGANFMFQALDASGHNSGKPKILLKNVGPIRIDVLKN